MKIGSETHKELFCRSFMANNLEYEPESLRMPDLDTVTLDRLRSIPFWEIALDTERKARTLVGAYTETVSDPVLREAIALQGMEETHHARLIETLIKHLPPTREVPPGSASPHLPICQS